ncbi:hypothetical protein BJ508DRAFT_373282 [Ascobolus immersus RN42]|uniref:MYND-type domain-containing protein n=1 Tax=Ascobolus immersus RN42 TaxID=1160509 RepID=A0A3N4INA5_ASCIM|nr:hypothetical protein BJ508DRAFT_373282 [Ascobolus immersus RN42]
MTLQKAKHSPRASSKLLVHGTIGDPAKPATLSSFHYYAPISKITYDKLVGTNKEPPSRVELSAIERALRSIRTQVTNIAERRGWMSCCYCGQSDLPASPLLSFNMEHDTEDSWNFLLDDKDGALLKYLKSHTSGVKHLPQIWTRVHLACVDPSKSCHRMALKLGNAWKQVDMNPKSNTIVDSWCTAVRNISVGNRLIPPTSSLQTSSIIYRCESCGRLNPAKRCTGCKDARYCSRGCQKKAWQSHKEICAVLSRISESDGHTAALTTDNSEIDTVTGRMITFRGTRFKFHPILETKTYPLVFLATIGIPYIKRASEVHRSIFFISRSDLDQLRVTAPTGLKECTMLDEIVGTFLPLFTIRREWNCVSCNKVTDWFERKAGFMEPPYIYKEKRLLPCVFNYFLPSCKTDACMKKTRRYVSNVFVNNQTQRAEEKDSLLIACRQYWREEEQKDFVTEMFS